MPWTWYLLMLLAAVVAMMVGNAVASWLSGIVRNALEDSHLDPSIRRLVVQGVYPLVVAIAVVAALSYLGADMTGLVAVIGAATLAIGMALQNSLSNLAAGAILLTLRPYREGEFVQVGGQEGTVEELNLWATVLRDSRGVLITLPNNSITARDIHNFTRGGTRRIDVRVVISYDADIPPIMQELREVLISDERVLQTPAPQVNVEGFNSRGVALLAFAWVKGTDYTAARTDLHKAVMQSLREGNVKMPTPLFAVGDT